MKQARRQKPRSADFYRRILRSRKPGQSYVDLAHQHRLKVKNLYQWASRFRNKGPDVTATAPLLPVVLTPQALEPRRKESSSEFVLSAGPFQLQIPAQFDRHDLRDLLIAMRSACKAANQLSLSPHSA